MVQIRDSLPLLNGHNQAQDSASMAAGLVAQIQSTLPPDVKTQLSTHKLATTHDHTNTTITPSTLSEDDIDMDAWLASVAKRIGKDELPLLKKACDFVKTQVNRPHVTRSGTYITGVGMTDILAYLFQDENALVAAMLYRTVRREIVSLDKVAEQFGKEIAQLVADTLAMGKLSETIEETNA